MIVQQLSVKFRTNLLTAIAHEIGSNGTDLLALLGIDVTSTVLLTDVTGLGPICPSMSCAVSDGNIVGTSRPLPACYPQHTCK